MADASSLSSGRVSARVWSDSCDVGFWVTSTRRKVDVLFLHTETQRSSEGDTAGFRIVIVND